MTGEDILDRARERLEDASHIAVRIAGMNDEDVRFIAAHSTSDLWRYLAGCTEQVRCDERCLNLPRGLTQT